MKNTEKVELLKTLLDKSKGIKVGSHENSEFKSWKNLAERTFIKIFGKESTELEHFGKLKFRVLNVVATNGGYNPNHFKRFQEDFKILIDSINEYIDEFSCNTEEMGESVSEIENRDITKIFISHASKDASIVEEIIELLESIGLDSTQIFCTSFEGYGIGLGENFLDTIKSELSSDSLVLFILSENFYQSPVCMCEMGASWVLSKVHIPIVVPPLSYENIKGVIPLTQGFILNEPLKLNSFKEKIEDTFNISKKLDFSTWERKRDRICSRINELIEQPTPST